MEKEENFEQLITIINKNRLKIIELLFSCKETLCGCSLIKKLNIPKNLLSYHIKTLEELGLVEEKRCGQKKNYCLSPKGQKVYKQIVKLKILVEVK